MLRNLSQPWIQLCSPLYLHMVSNTVSTALIPSSRISDGKNYVFRVAIYLLGLVGLLSFSIFHFTNHVYDSVTSSSRNKYIP